MGFIHQQPYTAWELAVRFILAEKVGDTSLLMVAHHYNEKLAGQNGGDEGLVVIAKVPKHEDVAPTAVKNVLNKNSIWIEQPGAAVVCQPIDDDIARTLRDGGR